MADSNTALLLPHTVIRHAVFPMHFESPHTTPGMAFFCPQKSSRTLCAATVIVPPVHESFADLMPRRSPNPTRLRLHTAAPAVAPAAGGAAAAVTAVAGDCALTDCRAAQQRRHRSNNKSNLFGGMLRCRSYTGKAEFGQWI